MLTSLNTTAIANAGAALVATSATALGAAITSHADTTTIVLPFAGILVGAAMTYFGRPSTLSATAGTATPAATLPVASAGPKQKVLSSMPPVTTQTLIGEFADVAITEIETVAKPTIVGLIQTGEVDAVAGLANLLKNLPKPPGIEGALVAPIEAALSTAADTYAAAAVAKYGPDVIFALLDTQLHAWAAKIGG